MGRRSTVPSIFTTRIDNYVRQQCAPVNPNGCRDKPTGFRTVAEISPLYIKHTLNHEATHMLRGAPTYNRKANGYHIVAAKKTGPFVMESFVSAKTRKNGLVILKIGTEFSETLKTSATVN